MSRVLPREGRLFRWATVILNNSAAAIPYGIKYGIGTRLRRGKLPYSLIENGDVVVQVGAPRDLVRGGRSRAIYFARLVGSGRVLVIEPDPENAAFLQRFAERHALSLRLIVYPCGAWSEKKDLVLLTSAKHPAATVLEGVSEVSPEAFQKRAYERIVIPVDTIDNLLEELALGVPKLVSITTNGAELKIVEGLKNAIRAGCPYISLARTGSKYSKHMKDLGYDCIGLDDRGFCYGLKREKST